MAKLTTPLNDAKSPRTRLIKVGEIVGKVGLSALPLPSFVSEAAKLGLEKIFSYVRQRDEQRILQFYRAFLYRDDLPDAALLDAEIEESNFHALLSACVSDIEEEKTVPYANLTKAIAQGRVDAELRRHFILTLRDLSWEELDLLRRMYVVTMHPVIPRKGTDFDVADLLSSSQVTDVSQALAVSNLKTKGMVDEERLSFAGKSFVLACSDGDDIEPAVYDYKVWSGHRCLILHLIGNKVDNSLTETLAASLRSNRINSYTALVGGDYVGRRDEAFSRLRYNCCVLLIGEGCEIGPKLLEVISDISANSPIVQVIKDEDVLLEEALPRGPVVRVGLSGKNSWQDEAAKMLIREINRSEKSNGVL